VVFSLSCTGGEGWEEEAILIASLTLRLCEASWHTTDSNLPSFHHFTIPIFHRTVSQIEDEDDDENE
jgi:hypothetical protein